MLKSKSVITNQASGSKGEKDIVKLVPCPNCGKKLMVLPPNYPLFDVQCTGCSFRAQVKNSSSKPRGVIFGAGWEIIDKVIKSGYMVPPLFVSFRWTTGKIKYHEIRYYPFIPKKHLQKRQLSALARRANYWMFNYINLDKLPFFSVYKNT